MRRWWRLRRRAQDGDRGAIMVEFALVFPILFMILLGLFTGAAAWNRNLAMSHTSRQALRFAVTLPTTDFATMNGWLDAVTARAIDIGDGVISDTAPDRYICVAYVHPDGGGAEFDSTKRRVVTGTSSPAYSTDTCYDDGLADNERRVQMRFSRGDTLNVLFVRHNLTLSVQAESRYEAAG